MNRAGAGKDSPDKITLLRDSNDDGAAELANDFLTHLHSPFGMTLIGNDLYVANTDAILRFHYEAGDIKIDTKNIPLKNCRFARRRLIHIGQKYYCIFGWYKALCNSWVE